MSIETNFEHHLQTLLILNQMQQIYKHSILCLSLILNNGLFAQKNLEMAQSKPAETPVTEPIISTNEPDSIPPVWTFRAGLGINIAFSSNKNNIDETSQDGFSTTNTVDLNLNYNKRRIQMTNEVHWQFSLYKAGNKNAQVVKSSDDLLSLHDWSIGFSRKNKWNFNVISKVNTSIFTIFDGGLLKDTTNEGKYPVQKFLNPYDATFSPGIKYQPTDHLRISFAPFTYRFYGTIDQKIADQGLYNNQYNADSTHIVKNIIEKKGAELNIWYDRNFNEWVVLQYRIDVSSNYAESILKNGSVNGFFITQIRLFKDLYLSHRAIVRGNLGQTPFKPQFSQVVTLSYGKTF